MMTPRAAARSVELFGYDYCPLVRKLSRRQNEQWISFGFSLVAHVCLLAFAGIVLIKPVEYGVDEGVSGIEVSLVAAPTEIKQIPDPPQEIIEQPVIKEETIVQEIKPVQEQPKPVEEKIVSQTAGKDAMTFQSQAGAVTEAKPYYLKNPAPPYPWEARRNGLEGVVVLHARIDKAGHPLSVEVETSSGHTVFDEAALKTVKTWVFHPAKLGNIPVESSVVVPIRFRLEDARR